MEPKDIELIEHYRGGDAILGQLWEEHVTLERQLSKLENKPFLSAEEQLERNRIKKLKLAGRDKMEVILTHYRESIQAKSHAG